MKSLSVRQAEKWLEKIKETDENAYKNLLKCLRRYEKTNDEFECFTKMNETLYPLPSLTQELNTYMDEGNKMVLNQTLKQRMDSFLGIVRATKPDLFQEIVTYINDIVKKDSRIVEMSDQEAGRIIQAGIAEIVKNYPNLVLEAERMMTQNQDEAIKRLNLKHLKNKQNSALIHIDEESEESENVITKKPKKEMAPIKLVENEKAREPAKLKVTIPNFISAEDEKCFIKQLKKKINEETYVEIIKVLSLYHQNIITKSEFSEIVLPFLGATEAESFKDIIECRELERRRNSLFKPLGDTNFQTLPRETHSYVEMPSIYPHYAQNRTQFHEEIFNNKWVSVPRGSEETFNVRPKNIFEIALIKNEDERYEFDLIINKFRKTVEIFEKILNALSENEEANVNSEMNLALSLGVIQIIYKNVNKDQKQIFEDSASQNLYAFVGILQKRVKKVLLELEEIRQLYSVKLWNEMAQKNFHKSLDIKNHEFKRCEKIKIRPQAFLEEINANLKFIQSRGAKPLNTNSFEEEKREFFSVLNSFETSSRKEKCINRILPTPQSFELKTTQQPELLPTMILCFEDLEAMSLSLSFTAHYIDHISGNEAERLRCRAALRQVALLFFNISSFEVRGLSPLFDEDKFFMELNQPNNLIIDDWISVGTRPEQLTSKREEFDKTPYFNISIESPSKYSFQPPKTNKNVVFYASENFYIFLRYLYTLYERIIRMREISNSERQLKLFEILFYCCFKNKESSKFEDNLVYIFGERSYLFATLYKITEGAYKSLNTISTSQLENYSFSIIDTENEDVYQLLLSRFMMANSMSITKMMRLTHELDSHLVYINMFHPFSRFNEENTKDCFKKKLEISKKVETYNLDIEFKNSFSNYPQPSQSSNNQEHYFDKTANKLVNLSGLEDIIIGERKKIESSTLKELEKLKKMISKPF